MDGWMDAACCVLAWLFFVVDTETPDPPITQPTPLSSPGCPPCQSTSCVWIDLTDCGLLMI